MSNPTISPRFIPLCSSLHDSTEPVFYYNGNVSLDTLYESAFSRLSTVRHLLGNLHEGNKIPLQALNAMTAIATLLLNDAMSLLEEFSPVSLQLRSEQAKTMATPPIKDNKKL